MKYVITGINRLTKEREIISTPAERQDIERLLARMRTRRWSRSAYTYMKAEPLSVAMNRQSLYKVMGEGA